MRSRKKWKLVHRENYLTYGTSTGLQIFKTWKEVTIINIWGRCVLWCTFNNLYLLSCMLNILIEISLFLIDWKGGKRKRTFIGGFMVNMLQKLVVWFFVWVWIRKSLIQEKLIFIVKISFKIVWNYYIRDIFAGT